MKNWHIRHKVFHSIFKNMDLGDDLSNETVIEEFETEMIVKRACDYPTKQTKELYYPGKSYAVAITFAKLLEKNFGVEFYETLDDPLLLFENDPYFVTYSQDKDTYDAILDAFPWDAIDDDAICSDNYIKTKNYFYLEFLLHEDTQMYAPADA